MQTFSNQKKVTVPTSNEPIASPPLESQVRVANRKVDITRFSHVSDILSAYLAEIDTFILLERIDSDKIDKELTTDMIRK